MDHDMEDEGKERYKTKVHKTLSKLREQATVFDFAICGELENAPVVVIKTANNTKIHFPLYEDEAERIISSFEPSPFSKEETLVNTSINNSWQLNPQQFEFLNPNWKSYVNDVVVPRIRMELCIQSPFSALLYKLYLYQAGSFHKAHRDKEAGIFATLVIQLPSQYKGGQLIVNYEGKSKIIALSSSEIDNQAYRTFYSVFYCDCEHELLPVIEGYRFCLVYNLIIGKSDAIPVPSPSTAVQVELTALFSNSTSRGKIIYALKHKYSETNLILANLKASDRAVADILKCLSVICDVNSYLSIFEKYVVAHSDERAYKESDNFDTDDEIYIERKDYELHSLIPISNSPPISGLTLKNIDFVNEVIPEDCFSQIKPYHKSWAPTGNDRVCFSKSTRIAAIVFWPGSETINILKHSGISTVGFAKYFLEEVEIHRENLCNENIQQKLVKIATSTLISNDDRIHEMSTELTIPILTALVRINDSNLLKKFLEQGVSLNESILPLVMEICKKFGWKTLSTQLVFMFQKVITLNLKSGVNLLNMLISDEIEQEKMEVCHKILETILDSLEENLHGSNNTSTYSERNSEVKKCSRLTQFKQDPSISCSLCCAAQKLNYDIMEFMKNKSITVAAEVLLNLVKVTNHLDRRWTEIVSHFIAELEVRLAKESNHHTRRLITRMCSCKDCSVLNSFVTGDTQSIYFKLSKTRRKHLQVKIKSIIDLKYVENESGFTVTKTFKTGHNLSDTNNVAVVLLEKLRKIL